MRKVIAAINMTLDGFCNHTAAVADDELHLHFADVLRKAGVILYGRITYQLMEIWPTVVKNPTGNKATDEFAVLMDRVPKLVFSRTLKSLEWESARLASQDLEKEVLDLRQQPGKDIFVGSPSLIAALTEMGLIDEYQLCIHPVILGSGLPLFKNLSGQANLKYLGSKTFGSGVITACYERVR